MDYTIKGNKLRMDMKIEKSDAGDDGDKAAPKEKTKKRKHLPAFLGGQPATPDEGDQSANAESGPKQMTTIMDMEKMEMIMLMADQKMYMVMPIKKAVEKGTEYAEKHSASANADVVRTGKTEKILGYSCDQILVTDKDKGTITEMWVASDLGMFMGLGNSGGGGGGGLFGGHKSAAAAKWEEVLKGKGGFPMRVITRDAATPDKENFRMEATKIESGSQPDDLFVPPSDYKKFQMPDLGSLFRQG